ncbi:histidinol dehydrogenase [Ningiella sp. W23]|uniref:histidinol dehydrogenase n=1 Tax=Ningiella sp. W23 TaxID=3023715 RepID=UPI003756898F
MINWTSLSDEDKQLSLARPALKDSVLLSDTVNKIVTKVLSEKDQAVLAYTKEFDGADLANLRLPVEHIEQAQTLVSADVKQAIDLAYSNIYRFHEAQRPADISLETQPGVLCEQKHVAISRVGLYVPGGSAPLPSTVLMLGVCAQVAGCELPILCTPPSVQGTVAPEILYAASKCGIEHIYLCGGAQAIAAMAFGTQTIPKVDKIYGPGNSFVTEAKQQVSQRVDGAAIDMPAGPSEVLVLADEHANPSFVASDLLSQAEHGPDSQAVLVSNSEALIKATQQQVLHQLATLSRKTIAQQSIANSRFILTTDLDEAVKVSNAYAAEHLIVQTENARALLGELKHAGSIFLGAYSPESAGDYASGTNHVLPTYGYARNYSSLGLLDFMRRFTVQELSEQGIQNIGPAIMSLAQAEGLDAHKRAVALRLEALGSLEGNKQRSGKDGQ